MDTNFLFTCCQPGAEAALKKEISANHPAWQFAFSRPGVVTFKRVEPQPCSHEFQLKSNFAQTHGWSLGAIEGESNEAQADSIARQLEGEEFNHLHVWHRPSRRNESGLPTIFSDETQQFGEQLVHRLAEQNVLNNPGALNRRARPAQRVLDCICLGSNQRLLGWHEARSFGQRWPAGIPQYVAPESMVSRAYLKMKEMLAWSEIPIQPGHHCVEIGSAPGGSSQALLESGMCVTGIDPAEMKASVAQHERFHHIRKRGADVKRAEYAGFRWMIVDVNLVPDETLAMIESIVLHQATHFRGMLITVKLPNWEAAQNVGLWVSRVKSWGFGHVRCRQLASNRQELCLAAMRSRGMRRLRRRG